MQPWDGLTEAGKIRRLRKLALAALAEYPIEVVRLRLVGGFTNVIFRVDSTTGPFAMRVDLHEDHSDADAEIELAWLDALATQTHLDICHVLAARDGRHYVFAEAPGIPGKRRCVLFHWIPGRPLGNVPTAAGYHRLGTLSAALAIHGSGFTPPHPPMAWDRVFYWPEEIDPVVIFDPGMAPHLWGNRKEILDRAIAACTAAFDRLDPEDAQVIHGDLHPDNVHVYRNRLIGFDFEDVTWGHRVQDIAITLFYERNHPGYGAFYAAFEEGYRSLAPWPISYEGELEHFMAARTVMFINYMANLSDDPAEYYAVAFPRLERFLDHWAS